MNPLLKKHTPRGLLIASLCVALVYLGGLLALFLIK
ncbi:MAG: hypothetical protein JWM78_1630 [Verrucomicrobiaceae bacterium]|nr:hypothetical protein [Verrucomicrobiaceae bacterium]